MELAFEPSRLVGAGTIIDVRAAEVGLGQAKVNALTAHNAARVAKLRLFQVMGVPADPVVLEAYAEAGFARAVHWLPSAQRGPVERAMDKFEAAIAEYTGG